MPGPRRARWMGARRWTRPHSAACDWGGHDAGWDATGDGQEWKNILDDAQIDELGSGIRWRGHLPVDVGADRCARRERGVRQMPLESISVFCFEEEAV
jgi:hypothetical protein